MSRRLILWCVALSTVVSLASCDRGRRTLSNTPVNWVLHEHNASDRPITYEIRQDNLYSDSGYAGYLDGELPSSSGVFLHSSSLWRRLPERLVFHWSAGDNQHWRFGDVRPHQLIPKAEVQRALGWDAPPLLIRITYLPEGRLRFSWNACVDATCKERGDPSLRFNAEHEFQAVPVAEPP